MPRRGHRLPPGDLRERPAAAGAPWSSWAAAGLQEGDILEGAGRLQTTEKRRPAAFALCFRPQARLALNNTLICLKVFGKIISLFTFSENFLALSLPAVFRFALTRRWFLPSLRATSSKKEGTPQQKRNTMKTSNNQSPNAQLSRTYGSPPSRHGPPPKGKSEREQSFPKRKTLVYITL